MSGIEKIIEQEGDRKDFTHKGLSCHIERHKTLRHLCGYVGIPKTHPLFKKGYSANLCGHSGCYEHDVGSIFEIHGGLTFANEAYWQEGKRDGLWYFGFDCAHAGDLSPSIPPIIDGVYRDMKYVEDECKRLAERLVNYASNRDVTSHVRKPTSAERRAIIEK